MKKEILNLILILLLSCNFIIAADKLPPKILSDIEFTNELSTIKGKKYQQHRLYGKKLNVVNPSSYISDHNRIWDEFKKFEKQMQDGLNKKKTIEIKGETHIYFGGLQAYYLEYEGIKDNEEIWSLYYFAPDMVGTDHYEKYPPKKIYEIRIDTNDKYAHLTRLDTEGYYPNGKINMAGWEKINGTKIALVETYSQAGKTTKYLQHQNENTAEIKIDFNEGEKEIDIAFNRKTGAGKYRHPEVEDGKWLCWNGEMRDVTCENFSQLSDFDNIFKTEKHQETQAELPEEKTETNADNSAKRIIENSRLGYTISVPENASVSYYPLNDGVTGNLKVTTTSMKEDEEWTALLVNSKEVKFMSLTVYMIQEDKEFTYEELKPKFSRLYGIKNPKIINEQDDFVLAGLKGHLFELEQEDGKTKRYMFQHLDGKKRISIQFTVYEQLGNINDYDTAKDYLKNIQIVKM
ncbi:hypothetical protein QYS49_38475 [Marivirga salinae]|uniref:Uncharacterized protein n=1 Tax=Marivirga salinarum TaxID=3059078 RepID=A0AA51ND84_9BACT|nr:hypothetical protein [Marivirga sp. BDSF4-3]WMN11470.1 hypothetical protein QYS49_38475 [Marivirga sp. BDSF4-3]